MYPRTIHGGAPITRDHEHPFAPRDHSHEIARHAQASTLNPTPRQEDELAIAGRQHDMSLSADVNVALIAQGLGWGRAACGDAKYPRPLRQFVCPFGLRGPCAIGLVDYVGCMFCLGLAGV